MHNADHAVYGHIDLTQALIVSSRTRFYTLDARMIRPPGGALTAWGRELGFGQLTGIDLGGENPGSVAAQLGQSWSVLDDMELAVGRGNRVQVTPIQLAIAYAAIANGGTVVTPHLGADLESPGGAVMRRIEPGSRRQILMDTHNLAAIRAGLHNETAFPGGTADDVFADLPFKVYGELGSTNFSTYAASVPASETSKPIVVVASVQHGGPSAHSAAPLARQILSQWLLGRPGSLAPRQLSCRLSRVAGMLTLRTLDQALPVRLRRRSVVR